MRRRSFLAMLSAATVGASQTKEAVLNRPKVPGTLNLRTRRRSNKVTEGTLRWEVAQTAIIICDMWDAHTCSLSVQRVAAMAPRMNQVVSAARSLGVMIIHAPSDTMKFYERTPWRERLRNAPTAASPFPIIARCPRVPVEERDFPIDDSAGGCDGPIVKPETGPPYPWSREHPAIDIVGFDGASESGQEIYNFCKQEGIGISRSASCAASRGRIARHNGFAESLTASVSSGSYVDGSPFGPHLSMK